MPFCYAPWSNLDISPQGTISPCCKFRHDGYHDDPLNINESDLDQYKKSRTIQIIKQDFQEGRWPMGCDRCRIEEENSVLSKRQMDYDRWKEHYDEYSVDSDFILTASVAFGNTCNLTCITCNPESSSRWQKEHFILTQKDVIPNHFYRRGFVDELMTLFPKLIHLDIPGGEPLLSGTNQQKELLSRLISQGQSKNITLHYVTNATNWPDKEWWDLWSQFQEVDLQISLDGIGDRFEYIRYPAEWGIVKTNVIKYQKEKIQRAWLRLSISHTVSAYNIYYLPEFFQWCEQMKLPVPWLGRVHNPEHMRPGVWSEPAKKYIINNLEKSKNSTWISMITNTDDNKYFDLFRKRVAWHDQYRGLDFHKTFPEMSQFL